MRTRRGAGFLGVCFGNVITANSPASQGESPSNWQSVLWHEFCHVVTLNKTKNAMPRWLSEGISVYEERQANATWGQWLTPGNREMLLGDALTPVSQLSAAFLKPESGAHLQFAYYESSLVVEFLVERYGFETLLRVLTDLGAGMPINESLGRYAGSIENLDREFADYARTFAQQLGPEADWSEPELGERAGLTELADFLKSHPKNYAGLKAYAAALIEDKQWSQAKSVLEQLSKLVPDDRSSDSAYAMLAAVNRALGDVPGERAALREWARLSSDGVSANLRLAELAVAESDWRTAREYAEKLVAVNPLLPAVQRHMARAAEEIGDDAEAIRALQALLAISSFDQVDAHYRLACLFERTGDLATAKRHVLQSLEEAPRFRDGHRKLLELVTAMEAAQPPTETTELKP
jgi:tetratricopeptide (TPR) repeat protein